MIFLLDHQYRVGGPPKEYRFRALNRCTLFFYMFSCRLGSVRNAQLVRQDSPFDHCRCKACAGWKP